jgi:hypothetical protein
MPLEVRPRGPSAHARARRRRCCQSRFPTECRYDVQRPTLAEFKRMVHEQAFLLLLDQEAAVAALPALAKLITGEVMYIDGGSHIID